MTIDILTEVHRRTSRINLPTLIPNLRNSPIAILRERNRACNPSIRRPINTPQVPREPEPLRRRPLRNQSGVRDSPLDRLRLPRVDVSRGKSRGGLVLRGEPAFGGDDKGLRVLLVADLADEGGVVGEHEVRVHDLGVGGLEGEGGSQLVGVDVAVVGRALTRDERSCGGF